MLPNYVRDAARSERPRPDIVSTWLLVEPTAEIDATDAHGWTLLHNCCLASSIHDEHVALAEFLLSRGADVNFLDAGGCNALFPAVARHHRSSADMVGLLLRAGSDVNNIRESDTHRNETPLAWAIRKFLVGWDERCLECCVKLLRAGASLDALGQFHSDGESKSIEEHMARQMSRLPDLATDEHFIALQGIVTDLRAAGSWRKYAIVPMKEVLRLRSLVARGRARAKLRTRSRTPRPIAWLMSPHVPNEIAWRVLEYLNPRE